jgi:hypothetical protein
MHAWHRIAALLVLSLLAVVAAASFDVPGRGADVRKQAPKRNAVERRTGPVISLWVIDHDGADPTDADLVLYRQAFRTVLAGCWISPPLLASVVFDMSDRATLGSGVEFDNLDVLQAMARAVGPTKQNCNDDFVYIEARLEGSVSG